MVTISYKSAHSVFFSRWKISCTRVWSDSTSHKRIIHSGISRQGQWKWPSKMVISFAVRCARDVSQQKWEHCAAKLVYGTAEQSSFDLLTLEDTCHIFGLCYDQLPARVLTNDDCFCCPKCKGFFATYENTTWHCNENHICSRSSLSVFLCDIQASSGTCLCLSHWRSSQYVQWSERHID